MSRSSTRQSASSALSPLRIGLVGAGTIGGGVYELLMGRVLEDTKMGRRRHRPMIITKVCVRDLSRPRSFHWDDSITTLTNNIDSILEDEDIDLIIDVISSPTTEISLNILTSAWKHRKMLVTANKTLITEHLDEIVALTMKAPPSPTQDAHDNTLSKLQDSNPCWGFGYEGAVCGGIPIIHTLQSCYTGDVIYRIQGIVNVTTNFLLQKMEMSGMSYEGALEEAQALGYPEKDPTEDIEGFDVRAKICLLAKLAFGVTVPPTSVRCKGISELGKVDFEYAKLLGCTIKLMGTAERLHDLREWDGPLCTYVTPVMIPSSHTLAGVTMNGNAVAVTSANMGQCCYTGAGAGRYPTANSIVADVMRLAEQDSGNPYRSSNLPFPMEENLELDSDYSGSFYIRIPYADGLGIIKRVGELAEQAEVSIHSILQNPIRDRMSADFVVTTEEAKVSQIQVFCRTINEQVDFCRSPCVFMPMLVEDESLTHPV